MIQDKVVIILGAGASKPFGLPLGRELLENIVESLEYKPVTQASFVGSSSSRLELSDFQQIPIEDDSQSSNVLFQLLLDSGFSKVQIENFARELLHSQTNSVDVFLEYRTEYIEIGKRAMAYNLLEYERNSSLMENPDWYKYIWSKMICPYEDFSKNNIAFITFNYDRTLEHFLVTSMSALYGKSEFECSEKLKSIPIIHLHGKLGSLPYQYLQNQVKFGAEIEEPYKLAEISKALRIIHEDVEDDSIFNEAKQLLQKANSICLLGFGFNVKNIERLKLNSLSIKITSTSYGLSPRERLQIMHQNSNIETDEYNGNNCLEFLRNEFTIN